MKDKLHHLLFSVVARLYSSLGNRACEEFVKRMYRINTAVSPLSVSVGSIVEKFSDVFRGFGVLPFTNKIQLRQHLVL